MKTKNLIEERIALFRKKFASEVIKQIDRGNSITLYPWKNPHSHQTLEVEQFLRDSMVLMEKEMVEKIHDYIDNDLRLLNIIHGDNLMKGEWLNYEGLKKFISSLSSNTKEE